MSAERAAPAARASSGGALAAPAFASTIRSWAAPPSATRATAAGPAVVATLDTATAAAVNAGVAQPQSFAAAPATGARADSAPPVALPPQENVAGVAAMGAAKATPPVQVPAATRTPTPVPAPAEPAAPILAEPASPDDAVRAFYALLEQGDFDQAAGLWTAHMRGAYPPAVNIYSRFARTQTLTVRRADVVAVDAAAGRATVAVDLTEVVGPPTATRRYVGTWQVVRGPAGWLLDQPNLQPS